MAEIRWIKIMTDIFDNRKIRQIEKMPDADAILVIWLKILCLAGSLNADGFITFTNDIPYTDEMLANEFGRPIQTVRMALTIFQQFGMLELHQDIYRVSNWQKYQNIEGMDKIREQTRLRVANYRENQKALKAPAPPDPEPDPEHETPSQSDSNECNVTCNATVTVSNATEKNKNKRRIERENNKGASPRSSSQDLDFSDINPALKDILLKYVECRKKAKKPVTQYALDLIIVKLRRESKDNLEIQIDMVKQSIENGWTGIFPLSADYKAKSQKKAVNMSNFSQREYSDGYLNQFYEEVVAPPGGGK